METTPVSSVQTLVKELGLSGYFPDSWNEFIGQKQAKRQLMVAAASARKRGSTCEHVLLKAGAPGVGKTTLGLLMAAELGSSMQVVSGKINAAQARILLSDMKDGDVLFYDEIHTAVAGGKAAAESWLLHLLENGVIMGPTGPEEQPKITVIGATTDAGRLPENILSRFSVVPDLVEYDENDAAMIAIGMAVRIFGEEGLDVPSVDVIHQVVRAANRNPRTIRTVLINLRDLAIVEGEGIENGDYDLSEPLQWIGLTADGLTKQAQEYLIALKRDFGGVAGLTALKDRLREPGGLGYTERLLMDKGYVGMAGNGRTLTAAGIKRAKQLEQEVVA